MCLKYLEQKDGIWEKQSRMIIIRLCFMAAFPALRVTAVLRLKGGRPEDPVHHMDNTERQKKRTI